MQSSGNPLLLELSLTPADDTAMLHDAPQLAVRLQLSSVWR